MPFRTMHYVEQRYARARAAYLRLESGWRYVSYSDGRVGLYRALLPAPYNVLSRDFRFGSSR